MDGFVQLARAKTFLSVLLALLAVVLTMSACSGFSDKYQDIRIDASAKEEVLDNPGIQGDALKESLTSFVDDQITRSEDLVRFWSAAKEGGEGVRGSELAMLERHESRLPALREIRDELAAVDSGDTSRLEELRQDALDLCIEGTDYDADGLALMGR